MRILFPSALIVALATASSAPAPAGNTAKRNIDQHLAPHRYDQLKTLIIEGTDQAPVPNNDGNAKLEVRVVLKADDDDRSQHEIHTTTTLSNLTLAAAQEVYLGWAMKLSAADTLGNAETKVDGQGSSEMDLKQRSAMYGGVSGWDGVNYSIAYDGNDSTGGWKAEEIWNVEMPNVTGMGIENLTPDGINAFMVNDDFSSLSCTDGTCTATVYSERIWDSQDPGHGYKLQALIEKSYDFIGWYYVYDNAECERRLEDDEEGAAEPEGDGAVEGEPVTAEATATPISTAGKCPTTIKGQSTTPVVFVLGALNGIAVASAAILTSMLF